MAEFNKHPQANWNEFQWENEIRRDERRISCYYRELPGCLDLPGEEEMIFNNLLSHPDLVPTGGNMDSLRIWSNNDDDEDEFGDDDPRRPGAEIIERIDRLAVEWNALCANKLRANLDLPGLGVACSYGKLLARTADFIDTDEKLDRGLKISLGKRTLLDLHDLVRDLKQIGEAQHSLRSAIDPQIEALNHLRERLIDQLTRIRSL